VASARPPRLRLAALCLPVLRQLRPAGVVRVGVV
jgi:hypothetical protein